MAIARTSLVSQDEDIKEVYRIASVLRKRPFDRVKREQFNFSTSLRVA